MWLQGSEAQTPGPGAPPVNAEQGGWGRSRGRDGAPAASLAHLGLSSIIPPLPPCSLGVGIIPSPPVSGGPASC